MDGRIEFGTLKIGTSAHRPQVDLQPATPDLPACMLRLARDYAVKAFRHVPTPGHRHPHPQLRHTCTHLDPLLFIAPARHHLSIANNTLLHTHATPVAPTSLHNII